MNPWQEGTHLAYLEEMEQVTREIVVMLRDSIDTDFLRPHRARIPSLICSLESLERRCRDENDRFGLWREDGLGLEEILEEIDADATRILDDAFPALQPCHRKPLLKLTIKPDCSQPAVQQNPAKTCVLGLNWDDSVSAYSSAFGILAGQFTSCVVMTVNRDITVDLAREHLRFPKLEVEVCPHGRTDVVAWKLEMCHKHYVSLLLDGDPQTGLACEAAGIHTIPFERPHDL